MSDICRKPTEKERNSFALRLTVDQLTMWGGPEWQRREASRKRTPPSEEEWDAYLKACEHLEMARQYEGFDEGCSCDHASIREPADHIEVEYAETEEEWSERAFALADERGGWPTATDYWVRFVGSDLLYPAIGPEGLATKPPSIIESLPTKPAQGTYQFKKEE